MKKKIKIYFFFKNKCDTRALTQKFLDFLVKFQIFELDN